jgi:hypothetical protein
MHGSVMMYATRNVLERGSKGSLQPRSITRAQGTEAQSAKVALVALAVVAWTLLRSAAQAQLSTALRTGWREAPAYVNLFAPQARHAAYRAYVSPLGLEATLKQLTADPAVLHPPGAWTPQAMIPYDAFGLSGSYNRWKVAGLYRSRRAQVARGPRLNQGELESWTLIAPYPDETLQRLETGTLVIVLRMSSD